MNTLKNLKKHIPVRKYRERAQPQNRAHFGFLEKKKDYQVRAKVFHKKEDQLNKLKLKAALANKEEFYFKMQRSKIQNGEHVNVSDDEEFDEEEYKKILKTQNQQIVKVQMLKDSKKIKKMKESLQMISAPRMNKQTFFVEDGEQAKEFDYDQKLGTIEGNLHYSKKQLQKESIKQDSEQNIIETAILKQNYNKLAETLENQKKMELIYQKLDFEKKQLHKWGKIQKVDEKKQTVKFFKQRQR